MSDRHGRAPKHFGRDERIEYAIIPRALSERAKLYKSNRYSNDGKYALVCSLADDPDRPTPPGMENAWRWLSVDEARATLNEDPNWTTDEVEQ